MAHLILGELYIVFFADNTDTVRLVYERTALVLYPSVGFESAGRVPIEADANGTPEVLDEAGYLFDPPQNMLNDCTATPHDSYVHQWLEVIDRWH